MGKDQEPVRRRWSKTDVRHARVLLAAERSDSISAFVAEANSRDLAGQSRHSDDIFLLALAVTLTATKMHRSGAAGRDSEFWEGLEDSPDEELVNVDLVRRIHRFALDPLGHRARGGLIPGPPQTLADMYTVCVCCNFALDDAVMRSRLSSSWGLIFRSSTTMTRLRCAVIPADYSKGTI